MSTYAGRQRSITFTVLTAVRSQEARGARWDEVDVENGIWTVPPERMKRKRPHRVPLPAEAMNRIRAGFLSLALTKNGSQAIPQFPTQRTGQ